MNYGNLAITSGFYKIGDSAPHGTNHAAYAISRGLAEHGRFDQIDIFLERFHNLELQGLNGIDSIKWGDTKYRTCSMDDLAHCTGQYVGIYVTGVAWLECQPFALRPVHDNAPVVCEIDCSHYWNAWQILYTAALSGKIRPTDGLVFKSHATLKDFRRTWEHWRQTFGLRRAFPECIMSPQAISCDANQHDPKLREETRLRLGIKPEEIVFLAFSRIERHTKGDVAALIFQWSEVARRSRQSVLLIAGKLANEDRSFLETLKTLARNCNVADRVIFVEDPYAFLPKAKTALMSSADVFLHLSTGLEESAPLTVLEAMAHGLPVVAANWSGLAEEVQDGVTGFLIPLLGTEAPDSVKMSFEGRHFIAGNIVGSQMRVVDPHRLREVLLKLAGNENLRRTLGEASLRHVKADRNMEQAVSQRVEFLMSLSKQADESTQAAVERSEFVCLDHISSSLSNDRLLSRATRLKAAAWPSKQPLADWTGWRRQALAERMLGLIGPESMTLEELHVAIFSQISEEELAFDWDDDASRELRFVVLRLVAGGFVALDDESVSSMTPLTEGLLFQAPMENGHSVALLEATEV